jgi:4-amino-4-deoxy-L-arabinose transferase-like glycosyltransferase
MAVPAQLRRNATLVAVAGLGFAILLLFVTDFSQGLTPAERDAMRPFDALAGRPGASRGVGMGVLGLPVSTWQTPEWVVRGWFLLLSTGGMVFAFRRWVRPAGKVAWTAAALFATSWLPLSSGGDAQPALYSALACVATAGLAMRWCVERDRGALIGMGVGTAVAALFRPADGLALAVGVTVVVAIWARQRSGPALASVGAGLALGWVPWLAVTLGVPGDAATRAATTTEPYAALLEGPGSAGEPTWVAVLWAAVLIALAVSGIVQKRWNHRRNAGLVGVTAALALVGAALFTAAESDVTMLLPAYALFLVAVAAGLLDLWHHVARTVRTPLLTGALVVAMGAALVWQVVLAAGAP